MIFCVALRGYLGIHVHQNLKSTSSDASMNKSMKILTSFNQDEPFSLLGNAFLTSCLIPFFALRNSVVFSFLFYINCCKIYIMFWVLTDFDKKNILPILPYFHQITTVIHSNTRVDICIICGIFKKLSTLIMEASVPASFLRKRNFFL